MMIREQKRMESQVMLRGILTLIFFFIKDFTGYELPNNIADILLEVLMGAYIAWAVRNSPRIKGEY